MWKGRKTHANSKNVEEDVRPGPESAWDTRMGEEFSERGPKI